jgi:small multidrug resistance pump
MNTYIFLGGAIVAEVIGTIFMKYSEGFTRLWPSVGTAISYCAAFYLLSQTLENIPTGIAYAIWSGAGIVLISLAGWLAVKNLIGNLVWCGNCTNKPSWLVG